VGDLLRRYEAQVAVKKKAYSVERYILSLMRRDPLASEPLATIRTGAIAEWRDRRLAKVGPGTLLRHLTVLRHVFEIARKEWGVPLPVNPTIDVRKPKSPPARSRRLEPDEERDLFAACARCLNPLIEPAVRLALHTGMRRGELLGAQWEHFDPAKRTVYIPTSKNGHPRTVPLDASALAVIDRLPRSDNGPLLPLSVEALKLAWKRLVKRARISDFHFHDLRHEAISRFFERGLTVPEVALISGHRDVRMLFRYTHLKAEDVATRLAAKSSSPLTNMAPQAC
jgi:integrase